MYEYLPVPVILFAILAQHYLSYRQLKRKSDKELENRAQQQQPIQNLEPDIVKKVCLNGPHNQQDESFDNKNILNGSFGELENRSDSGESSSQEYDNTSPKKSEIIQNSPLKINEFSDPNPKIKESQF